MAKTIKPGDLGKAISQELTVYHEDVTKRINTLGAEAIKRLVEKTKATAPKLTGRFRKNITSTSIKDGNGGERHVWHVKAPDHRLTHLLVRGYAKPNGGRVAGDPFLQNALNEVLPAYEEAVEEAVKQ